MSKVHTNFYRANKLDKPPPPGVGHDILCACEETMEGFNITSPKGNGTGSGYKCCPNCANKLTLVLSTAQAQERPPDRRDAVLVVEKDQQTSQPDASDQDDESQDLLASAGSSDEDPAEEGEASVEETNLASQGAVRVDVGSFSTPLAANGKRTRVNDSDSATDEPPGAADDPASATGTHQTRTKKARKTASKTAANCARQLYPAERSRRSAASHKKK